MMRGCIYITIAADGTYLFTVYDDLGKVHEGDTWPTYVEVTEDFEQTGAGEYNASCTIHLAYI